MLLRLYYLYEKSPKKCRELTDIISDLKEVFEFPESGGLPVRSQGSRWITHKHKALQRVIDRYGAYLLHLNSLIEDRTVKAEDRARIRGYAQKWSQGRILIGCALYIDILKPPSILSLTLQEMSQDVVLSIKHIRRPARPSGSWLDKIPLQWPTMKLVIDRIKDQNGTKEYQGASLQNCDTRVLESCRDSALKDLKCLDERMRDRLEWSYITMLQSILVFIDTQGWQAKTSPSYSSESDETEVDNVLTEIQSAVQFIASVFEEPLQAKKVDLSALHDEVEEAVEHACTYFSITTESCRRVWYKLHCSSDAVKWPNVFLLSKLLFSLPFSSGTVERIFSMLKLIKTDRRTSLNKSTLSDLLDITEGPALDDFSPEQAIENWWKACSTSRRVNQQPRKVYRPRSSTTGESSSTCTSQESEQESLTVSDWDNWVDDV